jgi:ATP-dependent exoDNAse (exonuclease V) alpha subunit
MRDGDVDTFARTYADHARVVVAPTAEHARERLVSDWLEAEESGEDAVMPAHRRRDVAELNQRARERLRALGRIGPDQLHTARLGFAVGDRVIARRNNRRLGVINGDAGRLTAIDARRLNLEIGDGRNLELAAAYAHAGHLDHGYALTAHLAQGSTVDRAFVLGSDDLYREWATQRSRATGSRRAST